MTKISIERQGDRWVADRFELPGSPFVGRGKTPLEALGALLWVAKHDFGVEYTRDAREALAAHMEIKPFFAEEETT